MPMRAFLLFNYQSNLFEGLHGGNGVPDSLPFPIGVIEINITDLPVDGEGLDGVEMLLGNGLRKFAHT